MHGVVSPVANINENMFERFSRDKTNYESGQVFPFLIAIIVVVIIMAMITVNLGQLSLYRTDVSNAADAGALAGASVLSGQLLSYGLTSDFMCGMNIAKVAGIVAGFLIAGLMGGFGIMLAIMITIISSNTTALMKAYSDSQMALTNARKTAMQYAYSNIGVDEPRPTYEEFLDKINQSPTDSNYDEYLKGETTRAREYARNGFAKFMDNAHEGWWWDKGFGTIKGDPTPSDPVPFPIVTSGYGWGGYKDGEPPPPWGTSTNSYEDYPPTAMYEQCMNAYPPCWQRYKNWVEVQVRSRHVMHRFEFVGLPYGLRAILALAAFAIVFAWRLPIETAQSAWAGPLAPLVGFILALAEAAIVALAINATSFGLGFPNNNEFIEGSYIEVTVSRYKTGEDVGLWKFRYLGPGNAPVRALSKGHAYRERKGHSDEETIEPTVWGWDGLFALFMLCVWGVFAIPILIRMWDTLFDTKRHLFETKIYETDYRLPSSP